MKYIITACLAVTLISAFAQDKKLLFHYSRYKEAIYEVGDVISFRVKGNEEKISWQITAITDSTIVSIRDSIDPHNISHVYLDKKSRIWFPLRYKFARIFLFAGIGYFLIDAVNTGEIDRGNLIVSGTFLSASLLSKLIIKKHFKLKGGRKLVILR